MKKGFNASAKFPAVKEKSAAFTGSCLGGKLPRPSRAHPAAGQGLSCARAFRLRPFLSFPGPQPPARHAPAQPNKALSHPQKPGARAAKETFFTRPGGRQAAAPKPRTSRCGTGPLLRPRFSFAAIFVISRSAAACVTWDRRSQTRRFPISKSQERGPLRARFLPDPAGGKLPRPSRAHPAAGRAPPAPALFVCGHFCHFSVRSRLRDMGPAQPNKALSHLEKPGARAAKGPFSPRPGGRQAAAPKPRTSCCGTGPSCARAFHLRPFCHFPVRSRLRDVPRRSQTRRFPIPKNQERGLLRVRFPPDPAASSRLRDVPRRSRLHLLGVCGMINTA